MKCLVLAVLVIEAVFTVHCRDVPGQLEGTDKEQQLVESSNRAEQLVEIATSALGGHQKERTEPNENERKKSSCKSSSSCVILGGSCMANASLCEGRIVAGCKGKMCQCCVPEPVNICLPEISENSSVWRKINTAEAAIKATYNQGNDNMTDAIKMQLDALGQELTNNQDQVLTNLANKVNTDLKNKMDEIKANLKDLLPIRERCYLAKGFLSPSLDQCFVMFNTLKTYEEADRHCKGIGLRLAKVEDKDVVWLRTSIVDKYGSGPSTYVGARGDGTHVRWTINQEIIASNNRNWWPGEPGRHVTTNHCLRLLTDTGAMNSSPTRPYYSGGCTTKYRFLCELA